MMTFIVGLTGGIGSGKTTVSNQFASYGISIVDADVVAREVVAIGTPALDQISHRFSENILLPDGNLNRKKLREIVFQDKAEKQWLEKLLHPLIAESIVEQLNQIDSQYGIFVSPLLLEGSQKHLAHRVLVVDVPEEVQIERTTRRDNVSEKQVKSIIAAQMSRQQRLALADDIIENWHGLDRLEEQVVALHQQYLTLSKQQKNLS